MKTLLLTSSPDRTRLLGLALLVGAVATLYACGGGGGDAPAPASAPTPPPPATVSKLNDTGITASQCFGAGTTTLVLCSSAEARALSTAQDGMMGRDADAATNSAADGKLGFSYTKIAADGSALPDSATSWSCVRDNVTGLMWEVKTNDGGLRDYTKLYTNYDNTQLPQIQPDNVNPTQAQIDAATNSVGFKNAVNTASLCGASDWRLPSVHELSGLVDYGAAPGTLNIDTAWFPNSQPGSWSSTPDIQSHFKGSMDYRAWIVNFSGGGITSFFRTAVPVRLVRGSAVSPQLTVSGDGLEVVDATTGLIWRRCAEGQTAANDTCTGTATSYTLDEAMARANAQTIATGQAWRVPNIKELYSMVDSRFYEPAVNETVFPAAPMGSVWSSTPFIGSIFGAFRVVRFDAGFVIASLSTQRVPTLRLVRTTP
jgi:Protein of unknown function (DUF1566)